MPENRWDIELPSPHVEPTPRWIRVRTALPTRWYLPIEDVRQELLVPSDTVSRCPYKGTARYWSVRTDDGVHRVVELSPIFIAWPDGGSTGTSPRRCEEAGQ